MPPGAAVEPGGLVGHLDGFVRAVREAGVPVGISQAVDAAQVLTVVDLLDREQLRHGLAAVLLRRVAQREVFDVLFDLWWPLTDRPVPVADDDDSGDGGEDGEPGTDGPLPVGDPGALAAALRAELLRLLLEGRGGVAPVRPARGRPARRRGAHPLGAVVLQLPGAARTVAGHAGGAAAGRDARRR